MHKEPIRTQGPQSKAQSYAPRPATRSGDRLPTQFSIGDNTRTFIEGMTPYEGRSRANTTQGYQQPSSKPHSSNAGLIRANDGLDELARRGTNLGPPGGSHVPNSRPSMRASDHGRGLPSSHNPSYPPPTYKSMATAAPPTAKSLLVTPDDVQMASRQTRIDSMAPQERLKQEAWAQSQIQRGGVCVAGFNWRRDLGGYICDGGNHFMPDELLAEGMGGFFQRCVDYDYYSLSLVEDWEGPYFPNTLGSTIHTPGSFMGSTRHSRF